MAELKTQETEASVAEFLEQLAEEAQRTDARTLLRLMTELTGAEPKMWGSGIIGFGRYRYQYESGRTGEWFVTGFAPRKSNLTLYIMDGFEKYEPLLEQLGRHKTGRSCLYLKRLADVDLEVLAEMIRRSVAAHARERVA
ncbi:MAG: DUF1801 domain-containing protein [Armatimonadetes bacterium]|nr:DUF1801 domain-containing protein [Armatimonadota bacterium]